MDLSLSENQEMLKKTAREFIEKEYPWQKVRDIQQSPQAFQPETWKQLNDLGWLGLPFPEQFGGAGGDFMDTVVLLEETGRKEIMGAHRPAMLYQFKKREFVIEKKESGVSPE